MRSDKAPPRRLTTRHRLAKLKVILQRLFSWRTQMRLVIPFACLTCLTALPAAAQQFQGMEYDQQLNFALQDMLNSFGYACQNMGDQNACAGFNYVQQAANYMVGASNACLQGNQDGCNAYAITYQDMSTTYQSYS
jgi:hypothetical protein